MCVVAEEAETLARRIVAHIYAHGGAAAGQTNTYHYPIQQYYRCTGIPGYLLPGIPDTKEGTDVPGIRVDGRPKARKLTLGIAVDQQYRGTSIVCRLRGERVQNA